ncbi:hypothetical protein QBC37DRAFT_395813 [Rhypophila decipiens]|uniref:Uncharacterized protein n=1 Tax=Rhypophila decipiens TaxID=261697 RepID=A0AAN6YKP9_9PEZI|nr:hypothetical protein QBC37DRAFT_395813 [Rhypophila decipiens]
MSFQHDPGVAFNELTVQADHHDRDWSYSPDFTQGQSSHLRYTRSQKWPKPRSLMEMTLDTVVKNLHTVNEETMASLPPFYLWRIYNECATYGMLSLHVWKIFSKLLLADKDHNPDPNTSNQLYSYRVDILLPSYELSYYTKPLVCADKYFLTSLTIIGIDHFRTDELLTLARLDNLSTLTLDYGSTLLERNEVGDRLVKGWSETGDAFPLLQTLSLIGLGITFQSLRYISIFPALSLYEMSVTRRRKSSLWHEIDQIAVPLAEEHGWTFVSSSLKTASAAATPKTPTVVNRVAGLGCGLKDKGDDIAGYEKYRALATDGP